MMVFYRRTHGHVVVSCRRTLYSLCFHADTAASSNFAFDSKIHASYIQMSSFPYMRRHHEDAYMTDTRRLGGELRLAVVFIREREEDPLFPFMLVDGVSGARLPVLQDECRELGPVSRSVSAINTGKEERWQD